MDQISSQGSFFPWVDNMLCMSCIYVDNAMHAMREPSTLHLILWCFFPTRLSCFGEIFSSCFFFCCCCKFWDIQSLHHTCKNETNVECNQLMMPVAIFRSRPLITAYAATNIVLLCLKVLTNYTKRVHVQQELKGRGGRTCLLLPCTG